MITVYNVMECGIYSIIKGAFLSSKQNVIKLLVNN